MLVFLLVVILLIITTEFKKHKKEIIETLNDITNSSESKEND